MSEVRPQIKAEHQGLCDQRRERELAASVAGVGHRGSVIHILLRLLFQILFPCRVPYAIQQVLVDFLFYIYRAYMLIPNS